MPGPRIHASLCLMPTRSDCIRARGQLDVQIGASTDLQQMPMPRSAAAFVLMMRPGSGGSEDVSITFRVSSGNWIWRAATVEWRYRTENWLHFGGTGAVNGRWPTVYRAGLQFDGHGQVRRLVLHGYAIAQPTRMTSAFVVSLAEGS